MCQLTWVAVWPVTGGALLFTEGDFEGEGWWSSVEEGGGGGAASRLKLPFMPKKDLVITKIRLIVI